MSLATSCLDETTFLELVAGGLAPEHATRVDAHLDVCGSCRRLVAQALRPLEDPPPSVAPGAMPPGLGDEQLSRGTGVGRYLVLEWLGAGGMGVVYAAYDPKLNRRVALKLLRTGTPEWDASLGRAHLVREAQAMARISHPHVVPVYDVGTFGDQVFLAMEYVEATTLRQWLRVSQPSWRQVRDAFLEAGRGLAAVHAAGLLHGDFKPENLLVGRDGRVRVTDFGLAHATALEPSLKAGVRGAGGTPAYMAPEQLREGGVADARSDQFSFCAALYEGLHGERPFAGTTLAELSAEVLAGRVRAVPRDSPVPAWLHRIVLRGLAVDPAARHPSLQALLTALAEDPVARRRQRLGRAAGLALMLAAVGFTHAVHTHRARACASVADGALQGVWDESRRRALERAFLATGRPFAAAAWSQVRRSLDAHTSAWVTTRTAVCESTRSEGAERRAAGASRMRCLDRRLAEVAALTRVLADADTDAVGRALRAVESLPPVASCADAAVLSEPAAPEDGPARARASALSTLCLQARALGAAGRSTRGIALVRPAAEAARAAGDRPGEAEARLVLAELLEQAADYRGAEQAVFAALWAAEASHHDEVAARAWTLAVRLTGERLEQTELAHRWHERAEAALLRWGGDETLQARLHGNLAAVLYVEARYAESDARYQQAQRSLEHTLGPDSLEVADVLLKRCTPLVPLGRLDEALALARRGLALRERALGPDHPEVGQALADLAELYSLRSEREDAERVAVRALQVLERAWGPEHPRTVPAIDALIAARFSGPRENLLALLPLLERSLRLSEASEGRDSTHVAILVNNLASAHRNLGHLPEAERLFRDAIARMERSRGGSHPLLVPFLRELAMTLSAQERHAEALGQLERAAAIQSASKENAYAQWGRVQLQLGKTYLDLGRPQQALEPLSRLVEENDPRLKNGEKARSRLYLARALWLTAGDRRRAVEVARGGLELLEDKTPLELQMRRELEEWLARHAPGAARPPRP